MQFTMSHLIAHVPGQQLTMPSDMMSRILAGFRLQTTTTRRFCICSTGTNLTRPLTTCRQDHHVKFGRRLDGDSLPCLLSFDLGRCCCAVALLHRQQRIPHTSAHPSAVSSFQAGVTAAAAMQPSKRDFTYVALPASQHPYSCT